MAEGDTFKVGDLVVIAPRRRRGVITALPGTHPEHATCYGVRPSHGGRPEWWTEIELEHVDLITRLGRVSAGEP